MFRHAVSLPRAVGSVFRRLDARDGVAANLDKRRSVTDQLIPRRLSTTNVSKRASDYKIAMYILLSREHIIQVAKWGNSLAVRLPAAVVDAWDLKEATTSKSALQARASSK